MSNLQRLIEIEKKYNLMERRIDGLPYWEFVRFRVLYDINFDDIIRGGLPKKKSVVDWKKCIINMLKKDAIRTGKKKEVMIYQDLAIYNPKEGYYECNITAPIIEKIKDSTFLLSQMAGVYPERRLRYPETSVVLWPLIIGKIKRMLYSKLRKGKIIKVHINKEVAWLADLFEREQNVSLDRNRTAEIIYNVWCLQACYTAYFTRVLKKVNPRVIIEQCYYGLDKMFLNQAAKKLHIPTVELQHGIMGMDHPAYNCLYRNVPSFPDYIFLFSEFWKNETKLPFDDNKIRIIGSCNLESKLMESNKTRNKDSILFISEEIPELFNTALDLCKIMRSEKIHGKKVLYKLHPGEDENYDYYCDKGKEYEDILQVVRTTDKNLYECFEESYIQVGESSTGLFEGVAYNLRTYIVDNPRTKTVVRSLIERGYAKVIKSADEILFDDVCFNTDIDYLWKKNALDNAIKEITLIAGTRWGEIC